MNDFEKEIQLIIETLSSLENGFKIKTPQARYIISCLKTMTYNMETLANIQKGGDI